MPTGFTMYAKNKAGRYLVCSQGASGRTAPDGCLSPVKMESCPRNKRLGSNSGNVGDVVGICLASLLMIYRKCFWHCAGECNPPFNKVTASLFKVSYVGEGPRTEFHDQGLYWNPQWTIGPWFELIKRCVSWFAGHRLSTLYEYRVYIYCLIDQVSHGLLSQRLRWHQVHQNFVSVSCSFEYTSWLCWNPSREDVKVSMIACWYAM